ncbi:MAG: hypothetical protein HYU78_09030 [Rhodocyclales bacterium]|nr:hypothetical protein [Rhodocyclales bacterium]
MSAIELNPWAIGMLVGVAAILSVKHGLAGFIGALGIGALGVTYTILKEYFGIYGVLFFLAFLFGSYFFFTNTSRKSVDAACKSLTKKKSKQ